MGTIKTTNIEPIADNGTVTLGSSGDTFTMPSGVTVAGGLAMTPAFGASVNLSQDITASTFTKIQFDNEILDTDSAYDPTTNYRFTVPSGSAGKYYISLDYISASSSNNLTYSILGIYKNGTIFKRSDMNSNSTANAQFRRFPLSSYIIIDLNDGDYIEAFAYIVGTSPYIVGASTSFFGAYKLIGV